MYWLVRSSLRCQTQFWLLWQQDKVRIPKSFAYFGTINIINSTILLPTENGFSGFVLSSHNLVCKRDCGYGKERPKLCSQRRIGCLVLTGRTHQEVLTIYTRHATLREVSHEENVLAIYHGIYTMYLFNGSHFYPGSMSEKNLFNSSRPSEAYLRQLTRSKLFCFVFVHNTTKESCNFVHNTTNDSCNKLTMLVYCRCQAISRLSKCKNMGVSFVLSKYSVFFAVNAIAYHTFCANPLSEPIPVHCELGD